MDDHVSVVSDLVVQSRIEELKEVLDTIIDNKTKQH